MSEGSSSVAPDGAAPLTGAAATPAAPAAPASAGALLRQTRQAAGVHIAALAAMLKVPVGKLEALEADNHAALPDIVFARALAASVCRILKIDPAPVLALLPPGQNPRLASERAPINAPVRGSAGGPGTPYPGNGSRGVGIVILVLLAAALALYFYPRQRASVPESLPAAPASASGLEPAGNDGAATTGAVDAAAAPPLHAPGNASAAAAHSPAASAAVPPASAATASTTAAAPPDALVLRARAETWVRVRDASGALAAQRTLAAGDTLVIAAGVPRPLEVVIGRANAAEVLVHGKPFATGAVARENVARFEVK